MSAPIPDQWTFNASGVARGFDQHVREQLPWYDMVTQGIADIGRHYVGQRGLVYDIGASNGNVGRALSDVLAARSAQLVGIEASEHMAATYDAPGTLWVGDALTYDYQPYDFAVAMLALMFVRPNDVSWFVQRLVERIDYGGALVLVERTLPPNGYASIVTSRLTLAAKQRAGASAKRIVAKELSLAGVQRPLDPSMLDRFGAIEWFRFGDFAGYIIEGRA